MSHLKGMIVRLATHHQRHSETDDMIYIGFFGKRGGREVALDVKDFKEFQRGTDVFYLLGNVWDDTVISGTKRPRDSQSRGNNSPDLYQINLNEIEYVYIRKQGGKETNSKDDAYKFDLVEVTLYGSEPQSRKFLTNANVWLARESGLTVYIPES